MAGQRILYLNADGLSPFVVERGEIHAAPPFSTGEQGLTAFDAYLRNCPPDTPLTLLVDLPDESHQLESVPFVRGRDRQPMIARRQNQLFGETPYRTYLSLGRAKEGRRDEQILFAALTRPGVIQPWLERIQHSSCILARMVSVGFLSRTLITPHRASPAPLLLAHVTPAGLRVSCFDKGQLRFTRLTPLKPGACPPSGKVLQTEVQRSFDYLSAQRILPRKGKTTAHVLALPDAPAEPITGENTEHGLAFEILDPQPLAQILRLKSRLTSADSLPLLLQALATTPHLPQFAPAEALAEHRLRRAAQAIGALGAATLLISLGITTANLLDARGQRHLAETRLLQVRATEKHLKAVTDAMPATPLPLEQLSLTLATAKALISTNAGPEPALRQLAAALAPLPGFKLRHIEWTVSAPTERLAFQALRVHFSLPSGAEHARQRVAQTRALLTALGTMSTADITIEKQPAEMNDTQPLRITEEQSGAETPQLTVRIQFPPDHP